MPVVRTGAGHWQVALRPGCPVTISRTVVCVCVCAPGTDERLRRHFGSVGAVAGLGTGLVAQSGQCVCVCCVALCCGMLNRIRGDLVRSSWYRDHGTAARMCVYVCVVCIIGLAVTWCGTVGVLI